jgi:hypothetical protein
MIAVHSHNARKSKVASNNIHQCISLLIWAVLVGSVEWLSAMAYFSTMATDKMRNRVAMSFG